MCISLEPATLSSTYLLAHEVELEGGMVNIIGYQNNAESEVDGPNAMILPIPSRSPMSSANCVDMTGVGSAFIDYGELVKPRTRGGMSKGGNWSFGLGVEVFDSGDYTVVLSRQGDLEEIQRVLASLPEGKRIDCSTRNLRLFASFQKNYPDWYLAICIWNGNVKPDPILWWYEPMAEFENFHFLPGLDAHDGEEPNLKTEVYTDHTLIVGMRPQSDTGIPADRIVQEAPEHLQKWLPSRVVGSEVKGKTKNGDWVLPKTGWTRENMRLQIHKARVSLA